MKGSVNAMHSPTLRANGSALSPVLVGCVALTALLNGCGTASDAVGEACASTETPMVNGTPAASNSLHNAALYHQRYHINGVSPDGWRWFPRPCTADRITQDGWYLTARHCVTDNGNAGGALVSPDQLRLTEDLAPGLGTYDAPPGNTVAVAQVAEYPWWYMYDIALVYAPSIGWAGRGEVPGMVAAPATAMMGTSVYACGYGQYVFNNDEASAIDPQYGAGTLRCMPWKQVSAIDASDFGPVEYSFRVDWADSTAVYPAHGDSGSSSLLKNSLSGTDSLWAHAGIHTHVDPIASTTLQDVHSLAVSQVLPWIQSHVGWFYIKRAVFASDLTWSRYLDVQWNLPYWETPVWAYAFMGSSAQHWSYDVSSRAIVNENGLCLDVKGGNSADGTPVQMYGCNNSPAQKWTFTTDFAIKSDLGGKCLSIPYCCGTSDGNGTGTLVIETCSTQSADRQQWMLTAAP